MKESALKIVLVAGAIALYAISWFGCKSQNQSRADAPVKYEEPQVVVLDILTQKEIDRFPWSQMVPLSPDVARLLPKGTPVYTEIKSRSGLRFVQGFNVLGCDEIGVWTQPVGSNTKSWHGFSDKEWWDQPYYVRSR